MSAFLPNEVKLRAYVRHPRLTNKRLLSITRDQSDRRQTRYRVVPFIREVLTVDSVDRDFLLLAVPKRRGTSFTELSLFLSYAELLFSASSTGTDSIERLRVDVKAIGWYFVGTISRRGTT